ncbi:hypothetical protein [Thermospira aquatica]|uniref:DUF3575 domain-containing protein n=1 Tax=Thermospira aquatica TaxID=2828656 RepID=A0AAX3BA26_9SPIR|nr:hypothetical protein [Thermospira aquatica]URA09104.1 hypothetical protein KDW03_06240 [Thermospira aquatica]
MKWLAGILCILPGLVWGRMWWGVGVEGRLVQGFWGQESGFCGGAGLEVENIRLLFSGGVLRGYKDMVSYMGEVELMSPIWIFEPRLAGTGFWADVGRAVYLGPGIIWQYHSSLLDFWSLEMIMGVRFGLGGIKLFTGEEISDHLCVDVYGRWRPWNSILIGEKTLSVGMMVGWQW